jgi:autotransporter-associated beta strand protein
MNTIRKLVIAAIFAGSVTGAFAQAYGTWTGGGADINWSTGNNWYGGTPPALYDKVYFEDYYFTGWTNKIGATNNIVDVSTTISALYYPAYSRGMANHYYTTFIPQGVTLSVGGTFGNSAPTMAVGDIPGAASWCPNAYTNYTTIAGPGALSVNDPSGMISVGGSGGTVSGIAPGTFLDMTNLYTFTASVAKFYQAVSTDNPYGNGPMGNIFLARTNTITTTSDGGAAPGVLVGSCNNTPAPYSYLILGAVNNFNVDAFVISGEAGNSNIVTFTNFLSGPLIDGAATSRFAQNSGTFTLRGSGGGVSRAPYFSIGDISARVGTMSGGTLNAGNALGFADFRNGAVDMVVDKLIIGRGCQDVNTNLNGNGGRGTLVYEKGNIDANNVYVGYKPGTNATTGVGFLTLQSNATMTVNNNLYLAYLPDQDPAYMPLPTQAVANVSIMDNAVLNIAGHLYHNDAQFDQVNDNALFVKNNGSSTLTMGGGTINMLNGGNVLLWNLYGSGTISNAFAIAINKAFNPGFLTAGPSFGTFDLYGNVIFQTPFPINFDLGSVTNRGNPYNDYVNIRGDVKFNNNPITFRPAGPLQVGTYRLIDYTGSKSGTVQFVNSTRSGLGLDQTTPGRIQLVVTNWNPGNLVWNGTINQNWTNTANILNWGPSNTLSFFQYDNVRFDDSQPTNAQGTRIYTNLCFPVGFLSPNSVYITNSGTLALSNSSTFAGALSGPTGVTKDGAGTLVWSAGVLTNTFYGDWHINQGVVKTFWPITINNDGSWRAFLGYGDIYVTNGATLDLTNVPGAGIGNALYISGSGRPNYTGAGAQSDGALLAANITFPHLLKVRLANDATISTWQGSLWIAGYPNNQNVGVIFGATAAANLAPSFFPGELSLNGYTLTVQGTNSRNLLLQDVTASTSGNIKVLGTPLRLRRSSITGSGSITFTNNGLLVFDTSSNLLTIGKSIVATNWTVMAITNPVTAAIGTNLFTGPVAIDESAPIINTLAHGLFVSNDLQMIEFDGPISGTASLNKMGRGPLALNAANTYAGPTTISSGTLVIGPSGTIPSALLTLNPGGASIPNTTTLDVSGATYAVGAGQTLNLNGVTPADLLVNGNVTVNGTLLGSATFTNGTLTLAAGAEVAPGGYDNQGQFVIDGTLAMHGAHFTWDVSPSFAGSDGLVVNGDLDIRTAAGITNIFSVQSIGGFPTNGECTLVTYTGNLITNAAGALSGVALNTPNVSFLMAIADPSTTPGRIVAHLIAPPSSLVWAGLAGSAPTNQFWDLKTTTNWLKDGLTPTNFGNADYVTFDQTGGARTVILTNSLPGTTGQPLSPGTILVDGASYSFSGLPGITSSSLLLSNGATVILSNRSANKFLAEGLMLVGGSSATFAQSSNVSLIADLHGNGTIIKSGYTNDLQIKGDASDFFGTFNVNVGQVTPLNGGALGGTVAVNGSSVATNSGTLNLNGQFLPANATITAAGVGWDGLGAINNRSVLSNTNWNMNNWESNVVNSLTLSGDTTIGALGTTWGIKGLNANGYTLTKSGAFDTWIMTGSETGLGDVYVKNGRLVIGGNGTGLGDANKSIGVIGGGQFPSTYPTLAFATTNNVSINNTLYMPPIWNVPMKNLWFSNYATLQFARYPGAFNSTCIFSGTITFTNDLNVVLDSDTETTLAGTITGPPAGPLGGSLIIWATNWTELNLLGTNTYGSNTWLKSGWLNITNQAAIPPNTTLIISNYTAFSQVSAYWPAILYLGGGGNDYTNRTLKLSSSNDIAYVRGDGHWWGPLVLHGNQGFNFSSDTDGKGLDIAGTNIDTSSGVGGRFTIGYGQTRIRPSLNLKAIYGGTAPNGTIEIGVTNRWTAVHASGAPQVTLDSTNNWMTLTMKDLPGTIIANTNNVLPPGGTIVAKAASFMLEMNGYNQSIGSIDATAGVGFRNTGTNDSTLTMVGVNYSQPGGVTNCTTMSLSDGSHLLTFAVTGGLHELLGSSAYHGPTVVTGGKLLVGNYSSFSGAINNSAYVDISGTGAFGGNGLVSCPVTNDAGGLLVPGECLQLGSSASGLPPAVVTRTGQLTLGNTPLTLNAGSTTWLSVDNSAVANSKVMGISTVTYGGTLVVTNIGSAPFSSGQVIKLFGAATYNTNLFGSVVVWGATVDTSNLTVDGTIKILSATSTAPVSLTPGKPNKNTLTLSWPADHIGWRLQVQTNSSTVGLTNNSAWITCDGATSFNSTNITIGSTSNVFYRLIYP